MKTPANNQEQKPGAEAPGAHTAWVVEKELESRLSPAGAGANKKAAPGDTRDGEKRAMRALREVLEPATSRPGLLDRKWTEMERAGIERDARAGLEPATSGLWARRADRCSTTRWVIRRPLFRRSPQSQLRHLCYPQCGGRHPGTDRFLRDDKRPQCAASCSMPEHRPHRRAS